MDILPTSRTAICVTIRRSFVVSRSGKNCSPAVYMATFVIIIFFGLITLLPPVLLVLFGDVWMVTENGDILCIMTPAEPVQLKLPDSRYS